MRPLGDSDPCRVIDQLSRCDVCYRLWIALLGVGLTIVASTCHGSTTASPDQSPSDPVSAAQLLDQFEAARGWTMRAAVEGRMTSQAVNDISPGSVQGKFSSEHSYRRFDEQVEVVVKSFRVDPNGGTPVVANDRVLWTPAGELYINLLDGPRWVTLQLESPDFTLLQLLYRQDLCLFLEGFSHMTHAADGKPPTDLHALLRSADNLSVNPTDDGQVELSGVTPEGKIAAVFSASLPRVLVRYRLVQEWGPGERPFGPTDAQPRLVGGEFATSTTEMEVTEWLNIGELRIAKAGRIESILRTRDGRESSFRRETTRSSIELLDSRGTIGSIGLPDGTPVAVIRGRERDGVSHIVQGGRIVPVPPRELDAAALAAVPRQDVGGPSIWWLGGLGLAAAAVVVATGVLVQRVRRAGGTVAP